MSQRTLRISVLATLLLFMGGVSAQADDQCMSRLMADIVAKVENCPVIIFSP